jgi:upstream activation factor subunit UAF30
MDTLTKQRPDKPSKKPNKKRGTGLTVPLILSDQLVQVVGKTQLSRCEVVKDIWTYIKAWGLQDPSDKRYFVCDDKLMAVFGKRRLNSFEMNKYLGVHLIKKL